MSQYTQTSIVPTVAFFPALVAVRALLQHNMADKQPKWTRFRTRLSGAFGRDRSHRINPNLASNLSPATILPSSNQSTESSHNAVEEDISCVATTASNTEGEVELTTMVSDDLSGVPVAESSTHSDVWSKAYEEAIQNMGDDIDIAILVGKNAEHLFENLGQLCKKAGENSAAARGIAHLKNAKLPLERLKVVIEVATPLGAIHPAASTALGVVKSVITVSITSPASLDAPKCSIEIGVLTIALQIAVTIAGADVEFAGKVAQMMEHIKYINDCDTFGQKTEEEGIHKVRLTWISIHDLFYS